MEHRNSKKSNRGNLILSLEKKRKKKITKYSRKVLIPTCTVIPRVKSMF